MKMERRRAEVARRMIMTKTQPPCSSSLSSTEDIYINNHDNV